MSFPKIKDSIGFNKRGVVVTKHAGIATVQSAASAVDAALFGGMPHLTTAVALGIGLYGSAMELRQERAIDMINFVEDNAGFFTEIIVQTVEFQDAFVYTLEKCIRERSEEKRAVIKQIFLGFAKAENINRFELERLINTISVISVEAIQFLRFIDQEFLSILSKRERPQFEPLSKLVTQWIYDKYDPNSKHVIQKYKLRSNPSIERLNELWAVKSDFERPIKNAEAELLGLGILRPIVEPGGSLGGGGSALEYTLTDFGEQFMEYVKNSHGSTPIPTADEKSLFTNDDGK